FFVYFVGCCPVERVNCPPVRTEPGTIRNDAIRRGAFSFIWLNPGPVGFRIAPSGDPSVVRSHRTCFGRSQDVIEQRFIRSARSASSTNFSKSETQYVNQLWR